MDYNSKMSVYHKTFFMMNYIIKINHVPVYLKQFYVRYSSSHCYQYRQSDTQAETTIPMTSDIEI